MEREAKALADYKKKKLKQVKEIIEEIERDLDNRIEGLVFHLGMKLKYELVKLLNKEDTTELIKAMGLKEEPIPKTKNKKQQPIYKDSYTDHKKAVIQKTLQMLDTIQNDSDIEPSSTKKKGRGRPAGSKNKPKAESSTRTRKHRGPGRPRGSIISSDEYEL
jgi:hypothetical protein